jgi:hypothetical protein
VLDIEVEVLGYTGYVPTILITVADSPSEAAWNPTPDPLCTPASIATNIGVTASLTREGVEGQEESPSSPVDVETRASTAQVDETTPASEQSEPGSEDSENQPGQSNYLWLLFTGAFLIVAGVLSLLLRRRTS